MQFREQFHSASPESNENGKARARVIKVGKKTKPDHQVFKENFITKLNSQEGQLGQTRVQLTSRETLLSAAKQLQPSQLGIFNPLRFTIRLQNSYSYFHSILK